MNDELNPAPLANGSAEGLGPVPVMGTEPVAPKKRRKRKAKPAAPKVARAPKVKPIDPLIAEQLSSVNGTAAAVEEAPTPSIVQGVGADHFVEARERVLEKQFRDGVQSLLAPPIKSTWAQRFVFGLRRMTGLDGDDTPARPSTQFAVLLCLLTGAAAIGVALPWL